MSSRAFKTCLAVALSLIGIAYLSSRLSFAPLPWPDGPAYLIPGFELVSWPPQWRMHPQAAFVPEYDVASFNIPPGLPLILGFTERLGLSRIFGAQLGIRVISILGLVLFAYLLGTWIFESIHQKKYAIVIAPLVTAGAVLDPVMRWGTMAVRTEIWTALAIVWGVKILARLQDPSENEHKELWKLSAALACAAYSHFAGVVLVPICVIALWRGKGSQRIWIRQLLEIGLKTCIFLLPMLIYIASNFPMFIEQMQLQFGRLSHGNAFFENPYQVFHGFFISIGSPEGQPKFFNIAKFTFWISILLSTVYGIFSKNKFLLAVTFLFIESFYLWASKPEFWFVPFAHMMAWILIAALLRNSNAFQPRPLKALTALVGIYALISAAANTVEAYRTPASYNWSIYHDYVSCIESAIPKKPHPRVWQVGYPDVLVELFSKNHDLDLTRSLDFQERLPAALNLISTFDLVILNFAIGPIAELPQPYRGPERDGDQRIAKTGAIPDGYDVWDRLHRDIAHWNIQICNQGPFWAELASPK